MAILTPTAPVRFCISRLRQAVAEEARFADSELLDFINEGYRSACERSRCLRSYASFSFDPGVQEAALPADHSETIRVYQNGQRLELVPFDHATRQIAGTYYQYDGTLGLSTIDQDATQTVVLYYAQVPTLLDYDATPQWGTEWNYLLRHYAAWRCVLAAGGAQTIKKAVAERVAFDTGVRMLARENRRFGGPRRLSVVTEQGQAQVAG